MRDKLIALLREAPFAGRVLDYWWYKEQIAEVADFLIAHGVTVQADVPDNNVGNKKPLTNGDCIRAMTDEEQAHFLVGVQLDAMRFERHKTKPFAASVDEWINWLKQLAKEETCIQSDM